MTENRTQDDRHGPNVRVHPPIIYAISILSGIGQKYIEYKQRVRRWL